MTPDTDGNCPSDRWGHEMRACGDGTCVRKYDLCDYNLAPLCPDYTDLLSCRNRTAEKKDRGYLCSHPLSTAYGCLDRSLRDDSDSPEDEESRKNETEKRTVPNSPPNCTQKDTGGEQLYPCTGYYPNTCGTKDICSFDWLQGGRSCKDFSSYTCLSKSKAEGCRDRADGYLPYFQCNKSGYYRTNQHIIHICT